MVNLVIEIIDFHDEGDMNTVVERWGLIPTFLHDTDERGAVEQFNDRYISAWNAFGGFVVRYEDEGPPSRAYIKYPQDPELAAYSVMLFRNEFIYLFPNSWVMVVQGDTSWEIARLD